MTPKAKAMWTAIVAGGAELLAYIANMPPSTQTHFLDTIGDLFPPQWKGPIGVAFKVVGRLAALYALMQARHFAPAPVADAGEPVPSPTVQPPSVKP